MSVTRDDLESSSGMINHYAPGAMEEDSPDD